MSTGTGTMDRRALLQALGAGVSIPALAALPARAAGLPGFGGGGESGGKVTELVVLTGVTPWLSAYQKVVAQYERDSGVRITLRPFPYAGMRTQMVNAIQSKNPSFDVYQVDESWTGEFYDNGWVRPLDDAVPGLKLEPEILRYDGLPLWDRARRTSSPEGRVMGLPLNGNVDLLIYRRDLYEKLGAPPPRTWEEAIANGKRAQSQGIAKYGYVTRGQPTTGGQSVSYEFMPVFYSYGANWFADEGKDWTPTVNSPAAQEAASVFRRLLELGPPKPQTVGQADIIAIMQGGQALQAHVVSAAAPQLEDPARSSVVGKCGYAVVPAGSTGKPAPTSGTWTLCIPADQEPARQKAAADFITWMLRRQQQVDFVKAGGIPTRADALQEAGRNGVAYLQAVSDSMPNIRRSLRVVFATAMLDPVERILGQIGAGEVSPADGLNRMQAELTTVVRNAGFLK